MSSSRRAELALPATATGNSPARVRGRRRKPLWRRWRRLRWVVLGLGLVFLAVAVDFYFEYLPAFRAVEEGKAQVLEAKQLLTGDIGHLDAARVKQARAALQAAADDFAAKSAAIQNGLLGGIANHLPGLGTQVSAARALRTAGASGTQFALDVTALVEKVTPTGSDPKGSTFERVVTVANGNQATVAQAVIDLEAFRQDEAALPTGPLLGPLRSARDTALSEGNKVLNAAGPALQIFKALPAAVGAGHHAYLLLLENPGEERPGGGFIGAVGEVDFTDGAITALSFKGVEAYTGLTPKSIKAPKPLDEHLFHGQPWELGDANWSPDFPTSMADVTHLYQLATGHAVDGVVSVDPVALGYVLKVLGPVRVTGYPQVITADNALLELNYITNKARPGDPGKAFLPPFGVQLVGELFHAPVGQMPSIAAALERGAAEKHVVMFFRDPTLEALVSNAGFGGQLGAPLSDSLMVNDANLSGTKGDLYVTRHYSLTATVGVDGVVHDVLTLTYQNPVPPTAADIALEPNSGGAYRDYLRVYVPETAQVDGLTVSINGSPPSAVGPEAVSYDLEREGIGYWLIVPRGGSATVVLRYSGPFADISQTPERYALVWQKQINALTWPIDVTVTMPGSKPQHWTSDLNMDRQLSVAG